jgi:hypothetical protein
LGAGSSSQCGAFFAPIIYALTLQHTRAQFPGPLHCAGFGTDRVSIWLSVEQRQIIMGGSRASRRILIPTSLHLKRRM